MLKNKYRVVRDEYAGFEVQIRKWWFPFCWFQCGFTNTHSSLEGAKEYIEMHEKHAVFERHAGGTGNTNV